jgi:Family of unknown function (DUF6529)
MTRSPLIALTEESTMAGYGQGYPEPYDEYRVPPQPTLPPLADWEPPPRSTGQLLLLPLLVGSLVAVSLGAYSALHEPSGIAVNLAGFSGPLPAKVWVATGAAAFAVLQLLSALVMYNSSRAPMWLGGVHRWSGRIAFVLAIPVAIHCLYAVGFQTGEPRALAHSLLGCLFFGAFVVKMLGLRRDGLAGWVLPVLGGFVFTLLIGLWLTSSLWFFSTFGVVR